MSWKKTAWSHPPAELLRAFEDGSLPEEHAPAVEAHLQGCLACCDLLAALPSDGFLSRLRHACENAPVPSLGPSSTPPPEEALTLRVVAEAPEAPPATGEVPALPGYDGVSELGRGGMGVVYAATHAVMGRRVAVKVLHPEFSCNPAAVERFRREVRAAARLAHPNIVTAHDAGLEGGRPFLAMEFVDGESLGDRLSRLGPLPVAEASDAVRQAALGVQHAHDSGLIHRDLKPHNLMRTADGTVKVCDFGLAALIDDRGPADRATAPHALMGTPDYMAPEQAEDARTADGRADVYSLGCTRYHLLTGQVPFPEESVLLKLVAHRTRSRPSVRRARADVPPELDAVLRRAMARQPADRYRTPGDLAEALRPFADPTRPPPRRRRRRTAPALAALAVLATLGIAGIGVVMKGDRSARLEGDSEAPGREASVPEGRKVWLDGQYDDCVWGAAFSPDGRYTLTTGRRNNLHERASGRLVRRLGDGVWFAAFSPDGGQTLTSDGAMRGIILSDAETGTEIRRFGAPLGRVLNASFSPDGKRIAASEWDTVHVYDKATGRTIRVVPTSHDCRPGFAFTPDGRLLVIHTDTLSIWTYEVDSGKTVGPVLRSPAPLSALALSPDGKTIVAATFEWNGDKILVWDRTSGRLVRRLSSGLKLKNPTQRQIAFLPDSRRALVSCAEGTLVLWDVISGRQLRRWDNLGGLVGLAASPDGRWALCGLLSEKRAFLFRLPDPDSLESDPAPTEPPLPALEESAEKAPPLRVDQRQVLDPMPDKWSLPGAPRTAFSSDGILYAAGGKDTLIRIWDRRTGKLHRILRGHTQEIRHVAFTPGGGRLVSSSNDRTLRVWDTTTAAELHKLSPPEQGAGTVDVSPDGAWMVSGSLDGTADLWDLNTMRKVHSLEAGQPCGAVFLADGRRVVTWSGGDTLKLWDTTSGELLATRSDPAGSVGEVRAPRGEGTLIVAGPDGLSWRDPATLREVRRLPCPGRFNVFTWGVSPDGRFMLVGASNEYKARLWDLEAGSEVGQVSLPTRPSGYMAFAPDGRHVVCGSIGRYVYLLKIEDGAAADRPRTP